MATGNANDPVPRPTRTDAAADAADAARDTAGEGTLAPPRLLTHRAEAGALPPPIYDADALAAVRRRWEQISASTGRSAHADEHPEGDAVRPPQRAPAGVRAKVKARVATAAAGVQAQDRAMTGELVGALDALARRVDELASRLRDLESLVQEVVEVTSEDLIRVQVAFGAASGHHDGGEASGRPLPR